MYTYIPSLLNHSHPCRLSQSIELGFLCDTSVSLQLSILHMVVYLCHLSSRSIPPSPSHSVSMHPLCLRLYSGPGTRFICNAISESLMRWVSHISAACLTLTSSRRAVSGRSHSEFTNIFPCSWSWADLQVRSTWPENGDSKESNSTWLAAYEVAWHKNQCSNKVRKWLTRSNRILLRENWIGDVGECPLAGKEDPRRELHKEAGIWSSWRLGKGGTPERDHWDPVAACPMDNQVVRWITRLLGGQPGC